MCFHVVRGELETRNMVPGNIVPGILYLEWEIVVVGCGELGCWGNEMHGPKINTNQSVLMAFKTSHVTITCTF